MVKVKYFYHNSLQTSKKTCRNLKLNVKLGGIGMKKMKKLVVICGLMVVIAWQSQNLIVETMRIVDFYGEKTNTNVVEIIDKLNDLWYFVEDLK